jgi:CMP-N,N'-diacetyllegionaminic acid synthase
VTEAFNCVALIPARAESKRVKDKNIRLLGGKPLLAWTIQAADESGLFKDIVVSSDSDEILDIARDYGAIAIKRPEEYATDTSPDIEWLRHALAALWKLNIAAFALLRPTSPFRTADTIRRAYAEFCDAGRAIDSLRAVERVKQHPGKMWLHYPQANLIAPLLLQPGHPWHSSQMAALPEVWVQNASMEIAWINTIERYGNQAGEVVAPFFTEGHEGFDINDEHDWKAAEMLVAEDPGLLPPVRKEDSDGPA